MDFHSWDNYLHQTGSKGFLESTAKKIIETKKLRNMKLEFHHQLPPFINTRNKKYKIYQQKKKSVKTQEAELSNEKPDSVENLSLVVNEKKKN